MDRSKFDDDVSRIRSVIAIIVAALPDPQIIPESQFVIFGFDGLTRSFQGCIITKFSVIIRHFIGAFIILTTCNGFAYNPKKLKDGECLCRIHIFSIIQRPRSTTRTIISTSGNSLQVFAGKRPFTGGSRKR